MKHLERRSRRQACIPLVVLVLAATGCGTGDGGDTARDTARAATSDSATARLAAQPPQSGRTKPPRLYSNRPSEDRQRWGAYVSALRVATGRDTAKAQACAGDAEHGDEDHAQPSECALVIAPAEHSQNVDVDSLDEAGYVVATIRNVGTRRDMYFGIAGGTTVYWRVYRRAARDSAGTRVAGGLASQFLDSATATPVTRPSPAPAGTVFRVPAHYGADEFPLRACTPTHAGGQAPAAKFQTCTQALKAHGIDAPQRRSKHNLPAWISCAQGCCAVEGGP